jgi:hypothetical protein
MQKIIKNAIHKLSPRPLIQFGIRINLCAVYDECAIKYGKPVSDLTTSEKRQGLSEAIANQL